MWLMEKPNENGLLGKSMVTINFENNNIMELDYVYACNVLSFGKKINFQIVCAFKVIKSTQSIVVKDRNKINILGLESILHGFVINTGFLYFWSIAALPTCFV